jgi:urease accessory protein
MRITQTLPALALLAIPTIAHAHPGHGDSGLLPGIFHPITGLDHLLAMLTGGILGFNLPALPFTETAIATSVLILGLLIATAAKLPLRASIPLTTAFALFHGFAHASELPIAASPFPYSLGFLATTTALLLAGLALATFAQKLNRPNFARLTGAAITTAAVAFLITLI